MSMKTICLLLFLGLFFLPSPPARSGAADALALTHANVIDGVGDRPLLDATVMLGALAEITGAFSLDTAMTVIERNVKNKNLLDLNRQALKAGQEWIANLATRVMEEAALMPS